MTSNSTLLQHTLSPNLESATLAVDARARAPYTISPLLYGKFCEHLGANIYHGMEAQILFNCTFGKWRFSIGDNHRDGGVREETDRDWVERRIVAHADRLGWPNPQRVINAYFGGGAYGWFEAGNGVRTDVGLSPDAGPYGDRAQRVEVRQASTDAPRGIGVWTYLPLHRTRIYNFRIVARAVEPCTLDLTLLPAEAGGPGAIASSQPEHRVADHHRDACLCRRTRRPTPSTRPRSLPPRRRTSSSIACCSTRMTHVDGADPDIIRMLREAHLPLLRWPGGNFVSGYHWRDGVGPVDARPTLPNPAWEGLEFNLFGTDEFIAFCRAVGCEPMICVNAGNGTPDEAAAWVEYCNGGSETPMGRLRAQNGHPEPYGVRIWEIGNEIYGHWQVGWTTPGGNVDRYRRFREAMLAADPTLRILGCGYGNEPDSEWNHRLIAESGQTLQTITDHILTGGSVTAETDPVELYHAFMGYPVVLEERYRALEARMRDAGIADPHLAITELQLFSHFQGDTPPDSKLTPAMMPRPDTIAEAISLTAITHMAIRLGGFAEIITHSATVNHGGGLRKERERVYANPVHYAHALGNAIVGGAPVVARLTCGSLSTSHSFAHIPPMENIPVVDAMAVVAASGDLVVTLVHRGADCGPIGLTFDLEGFQAQPRADVVTLAGDTWYDRNTREDPENIDLRHTQVELGSEQQLSLTLAPFSITQITLHASA